MDTAELAKLIKGRRSIRAWQDKPLPEKALLEAIELATYAPNAGNQQNWRFYLILKKEIIMALAEAVQGIANLVATWPEAAKYGEVVDRTLKRSSFWRSAPAVIAVAASDYQAPLELLLAEREKVDTKAGRIRQERIIANSKVQSASAAITTLLLALHQAGLGAVWLTSPMIAKDEIEKILKSPSGMDVLAFIAVGYPAEAPPLKERKPVKDVCEVIR
jgi:nitroreductase